MTVNLTLGFLLSNYRREGAFRDRASEDDSILVRVESIDVKNLTVLEVDVILRDELGIEANLNLGVELIPDCFGEVTILSFDIITHISCPSVLRVGNTLPTARSRGEASNVGFFLLQPTVLLISSRIELSILLEEADCGESSSRRVIRKNNRNLIGTILELSI